jgi:hypothetical protein
VLVGTLTLTLRRQRRLRTHRSFLVPLTASQYQQQKEDVGVRERSTPKAGFSAASGASFCLISKAPRQTDHKPQKKIQSDRPRRIGRTERAPSAGLLGCVSACVCRSGPKLGVGEKKKNQWQFAKAKKSAEKSSHKHQLYIPRHDELHPPYSRCARHCLRTWTWWPA